MARVAQCQFHGDCTNFTARSTNFTFRVRLPSKCERFVEFVNHAFTPKLNAIT